MRGAGIEMRAEACASPSSASPHSIIASINRSLPPFTKVLLSGWRTDKQPVVQCCPAADSVQAPCVPRRAGARTALVSRGKPSARPPAISPARAPFCLRRMRRRGVVRQRSAGPLRCQRQHARAKRRDNDRPGSGVCLPVGDPVQIGAHRRYRLAIRVTANALHHRQVAHAEPEDEAASVKPVRFSIPRCAVNASRA